MVTMETKVLKGIGAAFLPVPPAHTENWVSDTAWGRSRGQVSTRGRRRCSTRGKAGGEKSATILQPCPASYPWDPQWGPSEDLEAFQ